MGDWMTGPHEQCDICNGAVDEKKILNLHVINYFTGNDVNEPEYLSCQCCWDKIKKHIAEEVLLK